MLIFRLKDKWYQKIKSKTKTHEYREVKDYWTKRIFKDGKAATECVLARAYTNEQLQAKIKNIQVVNGKNTDLAIDSLVYDIEIEVIE